MLSMYEVATRRSTRGIKLSVGENQNRCSPKGMQGTDPLEFDAASMVAPARNSKERGKRGSGGGNEDVPRARPRRDALHFPMPESPRRIIHLDMDAFYAS